MKIYDVQVNKTGTRVNAADSVSAIIEAIYEVQKTEGNPNLEVYLVKVEEVGHA